MVPYSIVVFITFTLSVCADERGQRIKRIVGGVPVDVPPADDPTIYTNFAGKSARVQGVREFPHYVFRGIRYAHPPTGKDRFLRPRQKFLEGIVNATNYAPPCIQARPRTNTVIGDEDCLALNVFTPELPTGTEGLPVVVWIHGGGFRYGSASQYGVRHLVGRQLVVVTIQYRLGSLGFLSSGTKELPGNVALWDMVMAVQWVRNYIGFFGGNPYRIVVMGHDTGASSALMVALSNIAKGLTSGIIAMSGSAVSRWAEDRTPKSTARDIANQNGCPTNDAVTMVKCLQNLPPESIISGDSNIEFHRLQSRGFMSGFSGDLGTAPVTEGYNDGRSLPGLVQGAPMDDLDKSKNPKIPLMTGICKDETKRAVKGPLKVEIVNKLTTIPNFLDTVLINNLRGFIPVDLKQQVGKTLESFVPLNFQNYLNLQKQSIEDALDKVADVTNDVLFNVPAFLTVDRWSKNGAPTYLYSFEHLGKLKKGQFFLKGSPFIGNDTSVNEGDLNDTVAHGDDLAYLFDVNDVEGKPLESDQILNEDDQKVRDIFTQLVADFARYGKPRVNKKDVQPFSSKLNNFIQIRPKPVLANDFKYCEMALWCNIAERLKSTSCAFLNAFDTQLKNVGNVIGGVLNNTNIKPDVLGQITNSSQGAFGIFGGGSGTKNQNPLSALGGAANSNILGGGKTVQNSGNKSPLNMFNSATNADRTTNNGPKLPSVNLGGFLG